jgi:hypothetical protein
MRLVYNDPYVLRGAVEQLAGQQPIATRRERDLPLDGATASFENGIILPRPRQHFTRVKSNRRKARSK